MLTILAMLLSAPSPQAVDATPILIRRTRPAREVTMNQTAICGETVFELSYAQSDGRVAGTVAVRSDGKRLEVPGAQELIFDHLSYVADMTVACGYDGLPAKVLVMGTDRETGEFEQLYQLGFLEGEGFSRISGPRIAKNGG